MRTRLYLVLVLIRLYFALSPSYIHPDENFQGPEVVAGSVFNFSHHLTWEFDPSSPTRSVFPLWLVYGLPCTVLRWLWTETGIVTVPPRVVYYTLRGVMFLLSFVLEDWAIHELVQSPQQRRTATILVASSYVTWTYQTHTFSNSIETVAVLWSLVLIQRVLENQQRSSIVASAVLGSLFVFGTFNRITFPAFVLAPGLYLIPHVLRKPLTLLTMVVSAICTLVLAIQADTTYYKSQVALSNLLYGSVVTPLNSLRYNTSLASLSAHGLHPRYQHVLFNMPQLLGPVILFIPFLSIRPSKLVLSAATGLTSLSIIPHQEARFLIPLVPLLLASIQPPISSRVSRIFFSTWAAFNLVLGPLIGIFHQGGVVPMQLDISERWMQPAHDMSGIEILWWRTYSPPIWLLNPPPAGPFTVDLMGAPSGRVLSRLQNKTADPGAEVWLVAPRTSDGEMDTWAPRVHSRKQLSLGLGENGEVAGYGGVQYALEGVTRSEMTTMWRHIALDDLDIAGDGVWGTVKRLVATRGLTAWRFKKEHARPQYY